MSRTGGSAHEKELPDWFVTVAADVLRYREPGEGLWVDLGSGSGGLGLALARASRSSVLLIDPNAKALSKGLDEARRPGVAGRVAAVVGRAECLPLADGSVDLVVSRGSIFFWSDPPAGLREVRRVLRAGCPAMIGGGFGSSYPAWAFEAFFRRIDDSLAAQGDEAVRKWHEPRRPEWLAAQAAAAGIEAIISTSAPPGRWLLFEKDAPPGHAAPEAEC